MAEKTITIAEMERAFEDDLAKRQSAEWNRQRELSAAKEAVIQIARGGGPSGTGVNLRDLWNVMAHLESLEAPPQESEGGRG